MTPEQLFTEHFEKFRSGIFRSSLDHYLETGKLSGSALLEVRAMFEAHDKQKLNKHDVSGSVGLRYEMCKDQPAQIDCRNTKCKFYKGAGYCSNVSPAITLNEDKTFVCWSEQPN